MAADMENCQSNAIQQNSFLSLRWKEVNSPINSGIVNNLKKRKRAIFKGGKIKPWSRQKLSCVPWKVSSHQDERQHWQDVVGGVSEEGPPRQDDSLPRERQNVSVPFLRSRWQTSLMGFPLPALQRSRWGQWWPGCWRRPSRRWCRLRRLLWWWRPLSEGWKGDGSVKIYIFTVFLYFLGSMADKVSKASKFGVCD